LANYGVKFEEHRLIQRPGLPLASAKVYVGSFHNELPHEGDVARGSAGGEQPSAKRVLGRNAPPFFCSTFEDRGNEGPAAAKPFLRQF